MGYIDYTPEGEDFYNLVNAVGSNCPNNRDDVMMIQYMLKHLYVGEMAPHKPSGEMTVDGICGPVTINWILTYQRQLKMIEIQVLIDGRIDRIRDKSSFLGSISNTYYTLAYLNNDLWEYNPTAYERLPLHVPLSNPLSVPPPSNDVINPSIYREHVPATGGI
jgi:hypothetical protein